MSTASVEVLVAPFTIEIDHPRNDDVLLQSIVGLRMRSAIDGSKGVIDSKTGDYVVPHDQSRSLSSFPRTPGMRLAVNPKELSYVVEDPINDDEALTDRIIRFLKNQGRRVDKIKGVPTQKGTLDVHRMKTLCREVLWLIQAKEAKMVRGPQPKIEDIEELPGEFLLNPGSRVQNTQPVFEKNWDEWVSNLTRMGG